MGATAGSVADEPPSGWSRVDRLSGLLLCVLVLGSWPFLVHSGFDVTTDGSVYIVTARAIAAGEGYTYLGSVFNLRPPGFSALLAPLIALRGTDFHALNWFVSSFGVAATGLLFLYVRASLGGPLAALTGATVWFNPGFQRLSTQVMSDVPGVMLLISCLLIERQFARRPSLGRELALGVMIGMSAMVRSMVVLLVPAILAARVWRRWSNGGEPWTRFVFQRVMPLVLVVGFSTLPWNLYKEGRIAPPPATQTYSYSYATGMLNEDPGDPSSRRLEPGEILGRSTERWRQIATSLGSRLQVEVRGAQSRPDDHFAVHVAISLVFLVGILLSLWRSRGAAEILWLGNLSVLLVFFGFSDRLVLPLYVLALPLAVRGFRDALTPAVGGRPATLAVGLALLTLLVVVFDPQRGWETIKRHHTIRSDYFDSVAEALGEDAAFGTFSRGWVYNAYLERPVPGFNTVLRRLSPAAAVDQMIEQYDLDAVVIREPENREEGRQRPEALQAAAHLRQKYGAEESIGESRIWRMRPVPAEPLADVHRGPDPPP
jgi:hypothetical protein